MAITYIASASDTSNPGTSFSVTLPATQSGDILLLEYVNRNATDSATLGGTSGLTWTEKHSQTFDSTRAGKLAWARATGNHSTQTVTGSGLSNSTTAIVTVYRGALASGDPLADATVVGEANASADETQAQITTATNGSWVVLTVALASTFPTVDTQACTSPGSLTERVEQGSTAGSDCSISHASAEKATAGATGAFTWAMSNAVSGSWAYAIQPAATVSAAVTGTAGDGCTEAQVVAGGETIIITLTGDTWVAAGGTFDAQRQAIIDGLDSAQSEATGWNAEVRDNEVVGAVVRTSNTVVTITLSASAAYQITANETITVTVPAAALTGAAPITASPTFVVTQTASTAIAAISKYYAQMRNA